MSSASSRLCAACSRAGSGWSWAAHQRAVTACSAGHPSHAVALQVGDQIGAQQFLDVVNLASRPRRGHQ